MRNFLLAFIFLTSTSTYASLDGCLKAMQNMKLSRSITVGSVTTGVSHSYIANEGMIVSAYIDNQDHGKRKVLVYTPNGTVNVDTEKRSCSTEGTTTADEISAIINYNLTDYGDFGPQSLHKHSPADIKDLIAQCKSVRNDKITATMDSIEGSMSLPHTADPAPNSALH